MNGLFVKCMESKQPVEIIYSSRNGMLTQRVITIVGISDKHLNAYCHLRRSKRTFELENILSAAPYRKQLKQRRAI